MRVHRTKTIIEQDGSLSLTLTGLPFARGEHITVVLVEDLPTLPLSYRTPPPPSVSCNPEGEWVLFVIGAAISILFCVYLGLSR